MKRSSNKFLHRVRIHGGEFDASARAMHRDGMTSSFQAAVETVSIATIERKQMSTKTTFKRVALVTVAALGFGVMSIVPSQATINADSVTLSSATAAQTTAETQTATSAVATVSFFGAQYDSMSVTAALVSAPAGNTALPWLVLTETASATVDSNAAGVGILGGKSVGSTTAANTAVVVNAFASTAVSTAKFAVFMASSSDVTTAPLKAGTYVVKLTPASVNGSGALAGSTAQTLTITVTADASLDTVAVSATSIINQGETLSATADATVTDSMTSTIINASGAIKVTLKNAAGVTTTGESYTATITGSGTLGSGALGTGQINFADTYTAVGRAITVKAGNSVLVFPDGTSGVGTIKISSAAGLLLATETVTFYGAIASLVATVVKPVIGVRTDTGAITVVAKDAAGTIISSPTLYALSSDKTVISNSYTAATTSTAGKATFSLTGLKAGTANITIGTGSSAAATTNITAAAVAIRVGGGAAQLDDVKVVTDKTSYAPGEKIKITVTPVDAAGLALADDTYTVFATGGLVAGFSLPTGSDVITAAAAHDGGVLGTGTVAGIATYEVYAPSIEGSLTFEYTTGTMLTTALSAVDRVLTVAVSSPGTAAATDAANEATDAANAATDAANAAAEAADAATAAAQDAADAVAALSTQVATLISALKAQITSLTNLVIKIQKKVKA